MSIHEKERRVLIYYLWIRIFSILWISWYPTITILSKIYLLDLIINIILWMAYILIPNLHDLFYSNIHLNLFYSYPKYIILFLLYYYHSFSTFLFSCYILFLMPWYLFDKHYFYMYIFSIILFRVPCKIQYLLLIFVEHQTYYYH